MSLDHHHSPMLSSAAESEMVGYRVLSPAAIASLLLGLVSCFAVGNLLLLILPALAMVAAVLALVQIARSEGSVGGRWAAIAGLSLALLFASAAAGRSASRVWHVRSAARQFGDAWLGLVQRGELRTAHQWHLPPGERQLSGVSLAQLYQGDSTAQDKLNLFFESAPLSRVVAARTGGKLRFERVAEHIVQDDKDRVALVYVLDQSEINTPLTPLVVVAERTRNSQTGGGNWRVAEVVEPRREVTIP